MVMPSLSRSPRTVACLEAGDRDREVDVRVQTRARRVAGGEVALLAVLRDRRVELRRQSRRDALAGLVPDDDFRIVQRQERRRHQVERSRRLLELRLLDVDVDRSRLDELGERRAFARRHRQIRRRRQLAQLARRDRAGAFDLERREVGQDVERARRELVVLEIDAAVADDVADLDVLDLDEARQALPLLELAVNVRLAVGDADRRDAGDVGVDGDLELARRAAADVRVDVAGDAPKLTPLMYLARPVASMWPSRSKPAGSPPPALALHRQVDGGELVDVGVRVAVDVDLLGRARPADVDLALLRRSAPCRRDRSCGLSVPSTVTALIGVLEVAASSAASRRCRE